MPKRILTLRDCQELAASRAGLCLSEVYVNYQAKLCWRCSSGHEWFASFSSVEHMGSWCPICAGVARSTADKLHDLAARKGGSVIIDDGQLNNKRKLTWKCQLGHEWSARANDINNGSWCSTCKGAGSSRGEAISRIILEAMFDAKFPKLRPSWLRNGKRFLELDGYCEGLSLAFEYQGRHHYEPRFNQTTELWEGVIRRDAAKVGLCKERGVTLIVIPFFDDGTDDKRCIVEVERCLNLAGVTIPDWSRRIDTSYIVSAIERVLGAHRATLVTDAIAGRGGSLLTTAISRAYDKVLVRCSEGHEWKASIPDVIKGAWCGRCFGRGSTIDDMQALADSRGGFCLSEGPLKNLRDRLLWRCESGHEWSAMAYSVKAGKWCARCAYMRRSQLAHGPEVLSAPELEAGHPAGAAHT